MSNYTALVIGGRVIPAAASFGISQSYDQIQSGQLRRTVNGTRVDTTRSTHRKWRTRISGGQTWDTPPLTDLRRGSTVTIECVAPWRVPGNGGTTITLPRPAVSGSVRGYLADGTKLTVSSSTGNDYTFGQAPDWVEFRPILTVMLDEVSWDSNEKTAEERWSLSGEEV